MRGLDLAQVGTVGDVMPNFVRAYSYTNTRKRKTFVGERAVLVIAMFVELTNYGCGLESSVFPT